jgi:DNA-binding SARP family transcriptional activator
LLEAPWRIELFGALTARQDDPRGRRVVTRFRSHRTGVLFAFLALHPKRAHGREELIELLWPDYDLDAGRTSLRTALSSLRRQFEPPGTPAGSVLIADRTHARLNPAAITTDVAEFEAALRDAERSADDGHRVELLARAVELHQGPLLPGCYEAWILAERDRLDDVYQNVLDALTAALEQRGEPARALDYAHRMASADPLREEAHLTLMHL